MHVVGTAGHVDHGKSTLVRALTGVDPDRLAEEKRRGMTIELGFAEWKLRDGRSVGVVDVPGHQRLVRTMVAGAHGIDLVLLVVAADEGVMPQTVEHVAICELLGTRAAVVALSRCDLVDADTVEMARLEVEAHLEGTSLGGAPVVAVSGLTGAGLDELDATVAGLLDHLPTRVDRGRPRLFVDRAFSLPGFGPIVTGTLEGGGLSVGAELVVHPGGARVRVRGLHRHGAAVPLVGPGGRTAVNLAGVDATELRRGMALTRPRDFHSARRLDLRLRCAESSPAAIRHGERVRAHTGTAETGARVWLLDGDELTPGSSGHAQLRLDIALPMSPGDRVVVRRPSPSATLGGGEVLDVAPRRHRRHDLAMASVLLDREAAGPAGRLRLALRERRLGAEPAELGRVTGCARGELEAAREELGDAVVRLGPRWLAGEHWDALAAASTAALETHRATDPVSAGMARAEWRSRLRLPAAMAGEAAHRLVAGGLLEESGAEVRLPGRGRPVVDPATRATAERVAALLGERGLDPPALPELRAAGLSPLVLRLLTSEGRAVRLAPDVVVAPDALEVAEAAMIAHLRAHGTATVAQLRDAAGTTRRVAVPLLERLDARRVTVRDGDHRRLR